MRGYVCLFFDLESLKLKSADSNHDFIISPPPTAKETPEEKTRYPNVHNLNFQKTTYFQIFYNLKIHKWVKAIELSPITALGLA